MNCGMMGQLEPRDILLRAPRSHDKCHKKGKASRLGISKIRKKPSVKYSAEKGHLTMADQFVGKSKRTLRAKFKNFSRPSESSATYF